MISSCISIIDGQVKNCKEGALSKTMLENNKCYLLDCGAEVFVWAGRLTHVEERKAAGQAAEVMMICHFSSKHYKSNVLNKYFVVCRHLSPIKIDQNQHTLHGLVKVMKHDCSSLTLILGQLALLFLVEMKEEEK